MGPRLRFPSRPIARCVVRRAAGGVALLLLAVGTIACRGRGGGPAAAPPPPPGDAGAPGLRVMTTVLPITLFTRAVAEGCATVEPLLPPGADPHDLQTTPSELARVRAADVLVVNGLGLETFLERLVAGAANPRLRVIDAGRGIPTLAGPGAGHAGEESPGHAHDGANPHVWLDPRRAARQVETIRDGLIAADPRCRSTYTANAAAFLARLSALDRDLARTLAPYAGRSFVSFHDTAPYFAERYGLVAHSLVDLPEENPSPADLQRVATLARSEKLGALLREPGGVSRSFEALARDLGLGLAVFDPLETATPEQARRPAHYLETLRANGLALARSLRR